MRSMLIKTNSLSGYRKQYLHRFMINRISVLIEKQSAFFKTGGFFNCISKCNRRHILASLQLPASSLLAIYSISMLEDTVAETGTEALCRS